MAFPGNVNRYVVSGSLPGNESFAFGFYGEATDPSVTMQSLADSVVTNSLFTGFVSSLLSRFVGTVQTVRTYRYGSGSAAVDSGQANVASGAGTGGTTCPNYVALCVTLRTANASRRGRGRVYLPFNGVAVGGTTGTWTSANVAPVVSALGAWMDNLNARVVSEAASTSYPVTSVDADYVPDTQRGREGRLSTPRSRYVFV